MQQTTSFVIFFLIYSKIRLEVSLKFLANHLQEDYSPEISSMINEPVHEISNNVAF